MGLFSYCSVGMILQAIALVHSPPAPETIWIYISSSSDRWGAGIPIMEVLPDLGLLASPSILRAAEADQAARGGRPRKPGRANYEELADLLSTKRSTRAR